MATSARDAPSDLHEATIVELRAAMDAGRLTSAGLTRHFLQRVEAYDRGGPHLNAVLEVNPEALEIAEALDRERASTGPRGPLHGIPVLLKDNICTADRLHTRATASHARAVRTRTATTPRF